MAHGVNTQYHHLRIGIKMENLSIQRVSTEYLSVELIAILMYSMRVVNIAKRFFKACRTIQNYIPMETYPPYDLYRIRAYSNITSSSTDKIKQLIDRSVASGAWLILVYHKIEDGETGMYCSLESLEEVIDYAVNSGIRIMNFKDVFESGVVI